MKREASAIWNGSLREGRGILSTASAVLKQTPYSFVSRFEQGKETNPEELIAAAHAGCFSMALSGILGESRLIPESIETRAAVTMEKQPVGWTITAVRLDVKARVPGADTAAFQEAANKAKAGCPVSRVLNAAITMNATLEGK